MNDDARPDYDLAVVGAGPAGQAACLALPDGPRIVVIDEQLRPGGQILRQPPRAFSVRGWLEGAEYRRLKARLAAFESLESVEWRGGCSVLGAREAGEGWRLALSDGGGVREVTARRILIATGCYDMAVSLPGWTLPGAMSAGGVQAFVKSQMLAPGHRIAFAGSHPLQLLAADQLRKAGGTVAAVAFSQPFRRFALKALGRPWTALTNLPRLMSVLLMGWRLRAAGVPIHFGRAPTAVEGRDRVQGLRLEDGTVVACDAAAFCFGFLPQSDLPRAMGLVVRPARPGGWKACHDAWMRASRPGAYVAGETTGVKGADAAAAEGALAGLAVAVDMGVLPLCEAVRRAAPVRRARARALRFAALLEAVADPGPLPDRDLPADTIVCRCEDVTMGDLRAALAIGADAGGVKLATRCGMGVCQGRNCEHGLLALLGDVSTEPHGFTPRFPARPIRIGDLLAED